MGYILMVYILMGYNLMVYILMGYILMGYILMGYILKGYILRVLSESPAAKPHPGPWPLALRPRSYLGPLDCK